LEGYQIYIKSRDRPNGQLAAKSYMPFLRKLTTIVYTYMLQSIYNVDNNYDWANDPKGIKSRRVRKHTVRFLQAEDDNEDSFIDRFLTKYAKAIYFTLIPRAINEVDNGRGALSVEISQNEAGQQALIFHDAALLTGVALPTKYTKTQLTETFLPK
jgi:hypothetical protein